jgi:tetratricopeptide (TPR) repeat protein
MADRPAFRLADPDAGADGWTDLNLALVRAHATLDLHPRRGSRRLPPDIARRAAALIAPGAPGLPACAAEALVARRRLLEATAAPPAPEPPKPGEAELAGGLKALAEGRADEALRQCTAAVAADPASEATRCAGLAAEKLGRGDDAERYLRAWLLRHADDRDATLALARLVGRHGDDAAARAVLLAWVGAHADDADAWLNLGVAHARLGDFAAARQAWESVLRLRPDDADAKKLLKRLPR